MDIDLGFYITIHAQRIRLVGIDAPAPSGDSKAAGEAATEHLRGLVEGKSVIVRTFADEDAADRTQSFSNWLGRIYLDGKDINDEMVTSGNAVSVPQP
jgi:endonuclease YncB( thermonuclease family)